MPGCDEPKRTPPDAAEIAASVVIRVENVSKSYGTLTAVNNVSFDCRRGQILGFLGSDGAGKTTLLRLIAAMIRPSAGRIRVAGLDTATQRKQAKTHIGYMPQRFGLYQDLTVEENMDFFMDIYGISGPERNRRKQRYLGFSNLLPFLDRSAGALSGGMKQKLGLACVLVHEPDVLILDEPTNGVDPVSRQEFWDILAQMRSAGMTILVSTAYMDEGEKCDRLVLMHAARALDVSTPKALQGNHSDLEQAIVARLQATDRELAEGGFGT
jgi:ABC-2 type transport system ATP-binding protein